MSYCLSMWSDGLFLLMTPDETYSAFSCTSPFHEIQTVIPSSQSTVSIPDENVHSHVMLKLSCLNFLLRQHLSMYPRLASSSALVPQPPKC
jgi:hypothetical protein